MYLLGGCGYWGGGVSWRPPATAAVGTHPTGTHSCLQYIPRTLYRIFAKVTFIITKEYSAVELFSD